VLGNGALLMIMMDDDPEVFFVSSNSSASTDLTAAAFKVCCFELALNMALFCSSVSTSAQLSSVISLFL